MKPSRTFNFFLCDRTSEFDGKFYSSQLGEGGMYAVGTYMKGFFDQICQLASCPFDESDFTWNPVMVYGKALIYFINSQADSLVRQVQSNKDLGAGGTTYFYHIGGNLSEVYFDTIFDEANDRARMLAVLAFHEAMHNVLQLDNDKLHNTAGLGLAAKKVHETTQLTDTNKKKMAAHMDDYIPQNGRFL